MRVNHRKRKTRLLVRRRKTFPRKSVLRALLRFWLGWRRTGWRRRPGRTSSTASGNGDAEKIRAAALLLEASDAGYSESLLYALSKAIATNPEPVLEALGPKLTASQVCIARQIEPTREEVQQYIAAARAAVAKVTRADLTAAKDACLRELNR